MTLGVILLFATMALVFFGLTHRVLDRMQLTDKQALLVLALLIVGSFINVPLYRDAIDIRLNLGGALVPLALAIYVLKRANSGKETVRALVAALATTIVLYGVVKLMGNVGHTRGFLDPLYVYGLVGGLTAYIAGRSRRSAFISATLGVLLLDVVHMIELIVRDQPGQVFFGGAGVFDTVVVAGIVATLLAEFIGESRESLQGGPSTEDRPVGLSTAGMDGSIDGEKKGLADIGSDDDGTKNGEGGDGNEK
jgi:uncharacterized membrane protein